MLSFWTDSGDVLLSCSSAVQSTNWIDGGGCSFPSAASSSSSLKGTDDDDASSVFRTAGPLPLALSTVRFVWSLKVIFWA